MSKSKTQYIQGLLNIVLILFKVFNIMQDAKQLVYTEIKRSGRNLFSLIILGFLFVALVAFAWLSLMAIFYIKMAELTSPLIAISSIFGLHMVMIIIVALLLSHARRDFYTPPSKKSSET